MFRLVVQIAVFAFLFVGAANAQESRWKAEGWKTNFSKTNIEFKDVLSGGPPKDGIPPIDDPKFVAVSAVKNLTEKEPVIGLSIDGDARAYPLQVMTWHEIVNDVVGGKPVTVTYCPLCNAAIVFDAKVDEKILTFGTTGKLRNSDLIMYDRATESWWQQFTGEGIAGEYTGKKLKLIASRLESWSDFKSRHPNGKVLVPNNEGFRDYGRNPYAGYDVSQRPFLYNGTLPEGISPMARVVVIKRGSKPPLSIAMQLVRDKKEVQLEGLTLRWKPGQNSALHESRISKGRDVGSITVADKKTGKDVPYDLTFAFVSHAFHPTVAIKK